MIVDRRTFLAALVLPVVPVSGGRFVRNVPLGRLDGRPAPALNVLTGSGLDARRFIDLSVVARERLITPLEKFFIRTSAPRDPQATTLPLEPLLNLVQSAGTHVLECAGNTDPANFGLMSAAAWDGIPMTAVLDRLRARPGQRIQVTGIDPQTGSSRSSVAGASWIFGHDDLERTGAFLAVRMNGAELPRDNGAPVRLVVPGWYGCACIKWVARIEPVPDDAAVTSQMIEFARRTHQDGQPRLAADYAPPVIDLAATPVRVEQWLVDGRPVYRVVGIAWGGTKPAGGLSIRFRANEPFVRVSDYQPPASPTMWSTWSHVWRPTVAGTYRITLRNDDPAIRSRRLDAFVYLREVNIDEV